METVRIFVGYDEREAVAYHACCQSILERTSVPVAFAPLVKNALRDFDGKRDGSNAFIYSRFLVPYLCDWNGWALFLDGDMIVQEDIANLWRLREHYYAVQVVKHDYKTKFPVKYLGNKNEDYPRKNWSSVVLWNCSHYGNRKLTPDWLRNASGADLHRFTWLPDERIGELPRKWNQLVMEYPERNDAALLHYTIGTPCFPEYASCDNAEEWKSTLKRAIEPISVDLNVQ